MSYGTKLAREIESTDYKLALYDCLIKERYSSREKASVFLKSTHSERCLVYIPFSQRLVFLGMKKHSRNFEEI